MRVAPWAVLLVALLVPHVDGQSTCGTIDTTGATIKTGPGEPMGTVTIDPCAVGGSPPAIPELGTIGDIGTMTGTMPPLPDTGTGADGPFHATADQSLDAGTHDYTSFLVDSGVVVTCSGAVTINATEQVRIDGELITTTTDSSITIRCNYGLDMFGTTGAPARISAGGGGSHVDVLTSGLITLGDARISSEMGNVSIVALGLAGSAPAFTLNDTAIDAPMGNAEVRATYGVDLGDSSVSVDGGNILVQSTEGVVIVNQGSSLSGGDTGEVTVEGFYSVGISGDSVIQAELAPIRIGAFDGICRIEDGSRVTTDGDVSVFASGAVICMDSVTIESTGGAATVRSYGDDIRIEVEPPGPWGGTDLVAHERALDVRAAKSVKIGGSSRLILHAGELNIRALGGDVVVQEEATVGETLWRDADVDVRASNRIDATIPAQSSGSGHIRGGDIALSSGPGGIYVRQNQMWAIRDGFVTFISEGTITLASSVNCTADVLLSSRENVVVAGGRITTESTEGHSGSIVLESWASSAGTIDASNATVTSGAGSRSGDVSLLVRTPGAPTAVESFFLPKRIVVKVNAAKPERSKLIAVGFLDLGPGAVDLTQAATLTVGGEVVQAPGLVPTANGAKFVHQEEGLTFLVRPNKKGSSRGKFKIVMKRDLAGKVDPDAPLDMRFECGDLDGRGTCALTKGKYALKRVRGTLIDPTLYLARAKAAIKGAGKDKLKIVLGLATDGATPEATEGVRIRFGEKLDVTILADSFAVNGDRHEFKGDVMGITSVVLDYAKEAVTVKGKGLDLGDFAEGANAVLIGVGVGDVGRAVRVRMAKKGAGMRY